MNASENRIVVFQPNETVRLDVRLENETAWLTQSQMATLSGCSTDNIGLHLKNVYAVGELSREATTEDFPIVRKVVVSHIRRREDGCRNKSFPVFSPQSARQHRNVANTAKVSRNRGGWRRGYERAAKFMMRSENQNAVTTMNAILAP